MPVVTGLDNIVLGSALDMSAPEVMWVVGADVEAPHLAAALAATGADRADRAFELTLAGFLAHCRALLASGGSAAGGGEGAAREG